MKHNEMQWQSNDGLPLFARKWEPEGDIKGVICLVHGHGEHSGRYNHWAERLTQAGYAVVTMDLRGHGRSGGKRGHAPSYDHYTDDVKLLFDESERSFPGKPCFLYGHSLGGLIALFYLIQRRPKLNGAVITSPMLGGAIMEQKAKVVITRILGSIIPAVGIPTGTELEALTRDKTVIEAYRNDPLVHEQGTMRMGKCMVETILQTFERAYEIDLPLLIMHGTEDRITYSSGSEKLAGLVSGECTLKLWGGLYHELHNEPEKGEVFTCLKDWLDSKI